MVAYPSMPGDEVGALPTHFLKETASVCDQAFEKWADFEQAFRIAETVVAVPAFFYSDAPIRPRSKIPRCALRRLCFAFCWPKRVDEVARRTGLSVPTVKAAYLSLRELLLDPRYRKWHRFEQQSVFRDTLPGMLWLCVWSCYGNCHANRECQRNFRYKKRKERECGQCPILTDWYANRIDRDYRSHWLTTVDRTRDFYLNNLGIRHERGYRCEIFKRRVYHQLIISAARHNSRGLRKGKPGPSVDHLKRGPLTVLDLWETLLKHIADHGDLESVPHRIGEVSSYCYMLSMHGQRVPKPRCGCMSSYYEPWIDPITRQLRHRSA